MTCAPFAIHPIYAEQEHALDRRWDASANPWRFAGVINGLLPLHP